MGLRSIVLGVVCLGVVGCEAPADDVAMTNTQSPEPATGAAAAPATEAVTFEAQLVEQLQCRERADPTPLLIQLAQAGRINLDRNTGFDGLSCFDLTEPIMLPPASDEAGLPVETICAFDENYPETLAGTPYEGRLYARGPGTSPGVIITAVVREPNGGAAYRWLVASDARISARAERWSVVSDDPALVAITCNRLE